MDSSEIMQRLQQVGVPGLLDGTRAPRKAKAAPRTEKRKIRSYRGKLSPWFADQRSAEQGRRRMSPYQAVALGSGKGVVVNPAEANLVASPQDIEFGWSTAHWVAPGFSTGVNDVAASPFVHINFPEWVQ